MKRKLPCCRVSFMAGGGKGEGMGGGANFQGWAGGFAGSNLFYRKQGIDKGLGIKGLHIVWGFAHADELDWN